MSHAPPDPEDREALERLGGFIDRSFPDGSRTRALLALADDPADDALARLHDQVDQLPLNRHRRRHALAGVVAASAFSMAAAAAWLATGSLAPTAGELSSPAAWHEVAITPGVTARFRGEGSWKLTDRGHQVNWEHGTAQLHTATDVGLLVRTPEATVRPGAARIEITRDTAGSLLRAEDAGVHVRCADGSRATLEAQSTHRCLLPDPLALIEAADRLEEHGGPADVDRLTLLSAAVAGAELRSPVRAEALVRRMALHAEADRLPQALGDADLYLADGNTHRRDEVVRYAAWLGWRLDRCAGVAPYLAELPAGDPHAEALFASCTGVVE